MAREISRGGLARRSSVASDDDDPSSSSGFALPFFFSGERETVIGGIGRTLRWSFTSTKTTDQGELSVVLIGIADRDAFACGVQRLRSTGSDVRTTCAMEYLEGTGTWPHLHARSCDLDVIPDGWSTTLSLRPGRIYASVVATLLEWTSFHACIEDGTRAFHVDYGIERLGRSKWNFLNQDGAVAKPKQSASKWIETWTPSDWTTMTYTWQQLADRVRAFPLHELPLDLKRMCHIQTAATCERELSFRERRGRVSVEAYKDASDHGRVLEARLEMHRRELAKTASEADDGRRRTLTSEQVRELMFAVHRTTVLRPGRENEEEEEEEEEDEDRAVCMAYLLNGFVVRIVGPYEQNAANVGHGCKRRNFKSLTQYQRTNLPSTVLARICTMDGTTKDSVRTKRTNVKKRNHVRTLSVPSNVDDAPRGDKKRRKTLRDPVADVQAQLGTASEKASSVTRRALGRS